MADHPKKIIESLYQLCTTISCVNAVLRRCLSNGVITLEEFESIKRTNATSTDQIEALCLLLRSKSPLAFENFVVILRDTGNVVAANLLDKGQANAAGVTTPATSTSPMASNQPSDTAGLGNDSVRLTRTQPNDGFQTLPSQFTNIRGLMQSQIDAFQQWE